MGDHLCAYCGCDEFTDAFEVWVHEARNHPRPSSGASRELGPTQAEVDATLASIATALKGQP